MDNSFFATLTRMKYIERWALMRSARRENLSEHSLDVAVIAHALAVIGNVRYGKNYNPERAAILGLYHDAPEIITGDMPTPVKHGSEEMKAAYRVVEKEAVERLLLGLPEDLRNTYRDLLLPDTVSASEKDKALHKLVKAADKLSALLKCLEEERAGNTEFVTAKKSTEESLERIRNAGDFPELEDFLRDFLPTYGHTLDELLGR